MADLIKIEDHRPHFVIQVKNGNVHVIPISVFDNIASGKLELSALDDWELIMLVIIKEWLSERICL